MQTANGDFDFLNDKNMCSACWRCSLLTMEGGALRVKKTKAKQNKKIEYTCLIRKLEQQQTFNPQKEKIFSLGVGGGNERTNSCFLF